LLGKAAERLKHMRWSLLRHRKHVRGHARAKLYRLVFSKLATARAWILKETFDDFWHYKSITWARAFLDYGCRRAMRSRLEPMKKVARMLRSHEELILNRFRAKKEISSGSVEGLNNKIRVVTRRAYGFRTYHAMEMALYHTLGRLPEPESTHRFRSKDMRDFAMTPIGKLSAISCPETPSRFPFIPGTDGPELWH
jgi:transposase